MKKFVLIIGSVLLTLACSGGDKFSEFEVPTNDPNNLQGRACNADLRACATSSCSSGTQYCEDGTWGACMCDTSSGDGDGMSTGGNGPVVGAGGNNNGTCIPETCEEIGQRVSGVENHSACGIVTDNCGNERNCNNPCNDHQACGGEIWDDLIENPYDFGWITHGVSSFSSKFIENVYPNVCGEQCVSIRNKPEECNGIDFIVCKNQDLPMSITLEYEANKLSTSHPFAESLDAQGYSAWCINTKPIPGKYFKEY